MNRHEKDRGKKLSTIVLFAANSMYYMEKTWKRLLKSGHVGTMCKRCLTERRKFGPLKFKNWDKNDKKEPWSSDINITTEQEEKLSEKCTYNELLSENRSDAENVCHSRHTKMGIKKKKKTIYK